MAFSCAAVWTNRVWEWLRGGGRGVWLRSKSCESSLSILGKDYWRCSFNAAIKLSSSYSFMIDFSSSLFCVYSRNAIRNAARSVLCRMEHTVVTGLAATAPVWWVCLMRDSHNHTIDTSLFRKHSLSVPPASLCGCWKLNAFKVTILSFFFYLFCIFLSPVFTVLPKRLQLSLCSEWLWYFRDMLRRLWTG